MNLDLAQKKLQEVFGYESFRGQQAEAIEAALNGQDSLIVMPTGAGKSLCYQIPSLILPGLTLVISPLIALMKDQVDAFVKRGARATFINSSLSSSERQQRYQNLAQKQYDILYVTPERFRKQEFIDAVSQNTVRLLAIDEAHCISEWGHDFRPDYTKIAQFRELLGKPPTMALTATATVEVREDILKQAGINRESTHLLVNSVERPNLKLRVQETFGDSEKIQQTVAQLFHNPGSTIIYCSLVSTLERFSYELRKLNIKHLTYHGQLPAHVRKKNQERFIKMDDGVILATPAFGLGVDKPNIRNVIHLETPASIEAYYQEIGRAGRDGEESQCLLLYDQDDVSIQMEFLKWSSPDPGYIHRICELIRRHPEKMQADGADYLRSEMNFYNKKDFRVETSLNLLERWGVLIRDERSRDYKIVDEIPSEYLDEGQHQAKTRKQNEKLLQMIQFAQTEDCRLNYIYKYFGETKESCGGCDNCMNQS